MSKLNITPGMLLIRERMNALQDALTSDQHEPDSQKLTVDEHEAYASELEELRLDYMAIINERS